MAIKTFKRVEKKFLLNTFQKEALEIIVNEHMVKDKYCQNDQKYLIRNIYYDTKNRDLIHKSVQKPYHKEKVRVRKYGNYEKEKDYVFLEIKKKTGGVVSKRRVKLSEIEVEELIKNRKIPQKEHYLDKQVLNEIVYILSVYDLHPTVFISYERMAYFDENNKDFRLTFDSNLLFRRNNLDFNYHDNNNYIIDKDLYVLEIKINGSVPLWLSKALSKLKIYPRGFSKYGKEYQLYLKEELEDVRIDIA